MKPLNWNNIVKEYWYSDDGPMHRTRKKKHQHTDRQQAKRYIRECPKVPEYDEQEYIESCGEIDCIVCTYYHE